MRSSREKIEFGDFQTPATLADEICRLLLRVGENPEAVVEPTAGKGAFLVAAANAFPQASLRGFEIDPEYVTNASHELVRRGLSARSEVLCRDFFACDWDAELAALQGKLLLLGNPPWVTNAGISAIQGANLPAKSNLHGLRGIAARTGKSNFDISEWMLIRLLHALHGRAATLAMLCKTATARKVLRYAWKNELPIADAALYRIEAVRHFGASVDACLFFLHTGPAGPREASVFASLTAVKPDNVLGMSGDDLVADVRRYHARRHLEGFCPLRWRSGVKHDCSEIMELSVDADGHVRDAKGDALEIDPDVFFPLLKSSDLSNGRLEPKRVVLITQRRVGEDTRELAARAPQTWRYLETHRMRFEARKSSIYKGGPPFAIFGVGPYAFAPWKVAISGLHKSIRFQVVGPWRERPVFFDDTC